MKRLFLLFTSLALFLFSVLTFSACEKSANYTPAISQLRNDVLFGKTDNFEVSANLETREIPFIHDGEVGTLEQVIIFKITAYKSINEQFEAYFTTDKEYSESIQFEPQFNSYVAKFNVKSLPQGELTLTLKSQSLAENVELTSLKKQSTLSYEKAISAVENKNAKLFEELSNEFGLCCEINVRLIIEGEKNFWFVGITDKTQTHAFLVDGENLEILAEKQIDNSLIEK